MEFDDDENSQNFPYFDDQILKQNDNKLFKLLILIPQKWAVRSSEGNTGKAFKQGTSDFDDMIA